MIGDLTRWITSVRVIEDVHRKPSAWGMVFGAVLAVTAIIWLDPDIEAQVDRALAVGTPVVCFALRIFTTSPKPGNVPQSPGSTPKENAMTLFSDVVAEAESELPGLILNKLGPKIEALGPEGQKVITDYQAVKATPGWRSELQFVCDVAELVHDLATQVSSLTDALGAAGATTTTTTTKTEGPTE